MERPNNIEAALFDCDGVLIDSEPAAAARNLVVYEALGVPATLEDTLSLVGKSVESIPTVAAKYGVTITVADYIKKSEELVAAGKLEQSIYLSSSLQLMPGVKELLQHLRSAGIKTALVSSSHAPHVLLLLNRFGLVSLFDAIITGDMTTEHKPNPEPYLKAMDVLGVQPANSLVFEDSPLGIKAGVAAGAYVLGYQGGEIKQDVSAAHEILASYADFDLM